MRCSRHCRNCAMRSRSRAWRSPTPRCTTSRAAKPTRARATRRRRPAARARSTRSTSPRPQRRARACARSSSTCTLSANCTAIRPLFPPSAPGGARHNRPDAHPFTHSRSDRDRGQDRNRYPDARRSGRRRSRRAGEIRPQVALHRRRARRGARHRWRGMVFPRAARGRRGEGRGAQAAGVRAARCVHRQPRRGERRPLPAGRHRLPGERRQGRRHDEAVHAGVAQPHPALAVVEEALRPRERRRQAQARRRARRRRQGRDAAAHRAGSARRALVVVRHPVARPMSQDFLSRDEVDALMQGVGPNGAAAERATDRLRTVDLATQERATRARMPALDMLGERFAERLKAILFGGGRVDAPADARAFTPTEERLIDRIVVLLLAAYGACWRDIAPLAPERVRTEVQPRFVQLCDADEMVYVARFAIDIGTGGGAMQIVLPRALLAPLRDKLQAPSRDDPGPSREAWRAPLSAAMTGVEIELAATLAARELKLSDLLAMKAGDLFPIDIPERVVALVNGVPMFECRYGIASGRYALSVTRVLPTAAASTTAP